MILRWKIGNIFRPWNGLKKRNIYHHDWSENEILPWNQWEIICFQGPFVNILLTSFEAKKGSRFLWYLKIRKAYCLNKSLRSSSYVNYKINSTAIFSDLFLICWFVLFEQKRRPVPSDLMVMELEGCFFWTSAPPYPDKHIGAPYPYLPYLQHILL